MQKENKEKTARLLENGGALSVLKAFNEEACHALQWSLRLDFLPAFRSRNGGIAEKCKMPKVTMATFLTD